MIKVLITTTSFQDTPGKHHEILEQTGWNFIKMRGPLKEKELLEVIDKVDAVICGDDEYTRNVIKKGREGRLKYISKYGVGLDSIDLKAAKEFCIPVANCPGVNQVSVAEHVLALLLTFEKNIHLQHQTTQKGSWKRMIGNEISGLTIGIIGIGSVGKELAKKAFAFGLKVIAFDVCKDEEFLNKNRYITFVTQLEDIFKKSDIISLHLPHTPQTEHLINREVVFDKLKKTPIIINTSRGKLVEVDAIIDGLKSMKIRGYLTDVLEIEPIALNEKLKNIDNIIITPHVGSRTYQSVERQGSMAVNNLIKMING
ncbi:MAG: NAD(P)-dependent oxidoreductase [Mariprofundus sp.]|nr:NAD(P)-dependent oxidoreductase [Mariprofundus sp.]